MEELEIVESGDTHAIVTWRNLLVCVLSPGTPAVYTRVAEVQQSLARRWPQGLVSMSLLGGNFSALFSAQSRAQAREQLAQSSKSTLAMAIVIMVDGLLASATRTTMNALSALLRLRTPWRTFDAMLPAADWVAPHVAGHPTPAEIAAVMQQAWGLPTASTGDRPRS